MDVHAANADERQVGQRVRFSSATESHQGVIEFIAGQVIIVLTDDDQYRVLMKFNDQWTCRGEAVTLEA